MLEMLPTFNDVFKSFEDPQRLHAILVHIPIAVAVLGLILTLGVTLTGSKASGLRWTTVFIYLLGTLAALWAAHTGEEAREHLLVKPTGDVLTVMNNHEELAEFFWISLATTGFFILLSTVRVTWFRSVALVFALLASAASVAWVGAIGHYGGELVYRHSIGVPSAGSDHGQSDHTTDGKTKDAAIKDAANKDAAIKDADVKDAVTKDASVKDAATKDKEPVKDKAIDLLPEKDKASKDAVKDKEPVKDSGERLLPPVDKKDKSILFCS